MSELSKAVAAMRKALDEAQEATLATWDQRDKVRRHQQKLRRLEVAEVEAFRAFETARDAVVRAAEAD